MIELVERPAVTGAALLLVFVILFAAGMAYAVARFFGLAEDPLPPDPRLDMLFGIGVTAWIMLLAGALIYLIHSVLL